MAVLSLIYVEHCLSTYHPLEFTATEVATKKDSLFISVTTRLSISRTAFIRVRKYDIIKCKLIITNGIMRELSACFLLKCSFI